MTTEDKLKIFTGKTVKLIKYADEGYQEHIIIEFEDGSSTFVTMEREYAPNLKMVYYKADNTSKITIEEQQQMFILP